MLDKRASRFWKRAAVCVVGGPLLWFILAPFPGMGMIYAITDPLHGHPHRPHGMHPPNLVGLWVKEEPVSFGMLANALPLTEQGKVARTTGLSTFSWHCEGSRLSVDSVSRCGNCYAGIVTRPFDVEFDGPDRIKLVPVGRPRLREVEGWYRLTRITPALRDEMRRRLDAARSAPSSDQTEYGLAKGVLDAIAHVAPELAATQEEAPLAQR